jgi:hypothetical protein
MDRQYESFKQSHWTSLAMGITNTTSATSLEVNPVPRSMLGMSVMCQLHTSVPEVRPEARLSRWFLWGRCSALALELPRSGQDPVATRVLL